MTTVAAPPCTVPVCPTPAVRWGRCHRHGAPAKVRRQVVDTYRTQGLKAATTRFSVSPSTVYTWAKPGGTDPAGGPERDLLSGMQAAQVAGLTYRRVDYWASTGLVAPTVDGGGSGTSRGYTAADVEELRVAGRLVDAGLTLTAVRELPPDGRRRVLEALRREGLTDG